MKNQIQPEIHQVERLNVRLKAILNPFLKEYRAHVTVSWDEVEGLMSTRCERKLFRTFTSRDDFDRWVTVQVCSGFKVTTEVMEAVATHGGGK